MSGDAAAHRPGSRKDATIAWRLQRFPGVLYSLTDLPGSQVEDTEKRTKIEGRTESEQRRLTESEHGETEASTSATQGPTEPCSGTGRDAIRVTDTAENSTCCLFCHPRPLQEGLRPANFRGVLFGNVTISRQVGRSPREDLHQGRMNKPHILRDGADGKFNLSRSAPDDLAGSRLEPIPRQSISRVTLSRSYPPRSQSGCHVPPP